MDHHAQIATHPGDVLDHFVEQWQIYAASIERLTNEISRQSQTADFPGDLYAADDLYAAEQQQGRDKSLNALQTGVQLYHQEEQHRRWLESHSLSTSSILRPDHGHAYSGIELREHARAHFGDAIDGNVYINHCGPSSPSSQQNVATFDSTAMRSLPAVNHADGKPQSNEQIAAVQKTMQTFNAYITHQLSMAIQQTQPHRSQILEERWPQFVGPRRTGRNSELVQEQADKRSTGSHRSKRVAFRAKFRMPITSHLKYGRSHASMLIRAGSYVSAHTIVDRQTRRSSDTALREISQRSENSSRTEKRRYLT